MERILKKISKQQELFNNSIIELAELTKLAVYNEDFRRVQNYLSDKEWLEDKVTQLQNQRNNLIAEIQQKANELYYIETEKNCNHIIYYQDLKKLFDDKRTILQENDNHLFLRSLAHFAAIQGNTSEATMYYNMYLNFEGEPPIQSYVEIEE